MKDRIISDYLSLIFETKAECAEWFGYYNYDTLNTEHTKMLCNRSQSEKPAIKRGDTIELGYYEIPFGIWHHIDYSDSWNWQQGAMLQWLPSENGSETKVIYNCSRNNHLISRIHDIETDETIDIDWPIYGITPDGKKSITLDLERSYWCRAYHYQSVENKDKDGRIIDGDGIFEIDLENNRRKLIIDINDIVNLKPDENFNEMKHWVEHIMINPDGTRFCFLHRYSPINNIRQYKTRVCLANIDGSELQVLPGWNMYSWSHFAWQGSNKFAIYTYKRPIICNNYISNKQNEKIKNYNPQIILKHILTIIKKIVPQKIIKQIQHNNSFYQQYIFNEAGKCVLNDQWINTNLNIDGHPSFTFDEKYMLTDSYPNDLKYRRYIIYNIENKKSLILAKMLENSRHGNVACDLHPKLSRDNQYVVFDTTSSGKHSMVLFQINWNLLKNIII